MDVNKIGDENILHFPTSPDAPDQCQDDTCTDQ